MGQKYLNFDKQQAAQQDVFTSKHIEGDNVNTRENMQVLLASGVV